jgi:hypothetical protein
VGKLGAWLWLATQNLEDFPDASKKLLSLLLAAHKEPGLYTEGVVMADKVQALFRNVPPPIALAMTEKHEKRQRAGIMQRLGCTCTEPEAAFEVAKQQHR